MENILSRLARNPHAPIDSASVSWIDEMGNGYDDWRNIIAPAQAPQQPQSWGDLAYGVATAPMRFGNALAQSLNPYKGNEHPITDPNASNWQVPPLVQDSWEALNAPGNAYHNGMSEDDMRRNANIMAGLAMGGGGFAARPAGSAGMFAGRLAKTADHEALARAEAMATEGADRRAIWDQTGWFQGPDKQWRFEIDDSGSFYNPTRGATQVGHALQHPDLVTAYPDVPNVKLNFSQKAGGGAYFNTLDRIGLGYEATPKDHGVLLHELQHRIQNNDGYGRGGSYEQSSSAFTDPEYKRLSGEVESRNVERRLSMSPEERRATPPWETQDIPDADQIVRMYSNASKEAAVPALASALDMSPEARLARAREMGFDTDTTWYHGTRTGGFDEFDPSRANSSSKTGVPDGAMVFTSSPENASSYAVTKKGMWGDQIDYEPGASVLPVHLDGRTLDMVVDAKGANWRDIEHQGNVYDANELAQLAKDLEYEGLLVRNVVDSKVSHGAKPSDTYFKFSPQGIRSVNAAFDPSKADSANLLAANADSRAALASGLVQDQNQNYPYLWPWVR